MADKAQLAMLKRSVAEWNAWRKANPNVMPDLFGSDLRGAHLGRVNLGEVYLQEASLDNAILRGANLQGTDLKGANLQGTDLKGANLQGADLKGANLQEVKLQVTKFQGAELRGAAFQNAIVGETLFINIDLSDVKGLETVIHYRPSRIDVDTLYKSRGKISEIFLRGCGVPDSLIEYLPSLIGAMEPIQFYSCFISYSTKDEEFARRMHSRMQQEHLRVWYAPEELKGGQKLREQLDEAIRVYDKLLLVLSDASMASPWVAHEIGRAFAREKREGKQVLFPIRLCAFDALQDWELPDDDTGRDLAKEIRRYYIPDFSNWEYQKTFEEAFAQLLKALRATTP